MRFFYKIILKKKLKSLKNLAQNNQQIEKLYDALKNALSENISQKEKHKIQEIEKLRNNLIKNKSSIEVIDFGAGSRFKKHDELSANLGIQKTKQLRQICKREAKSKFWAFVLFNIIKNFQPKQCLELGTNLGISALYQLAVLENIESSFLTSIEGSPDLCKLAEQHIQSLKFENYNIVCGKFDDVLEKTLQELKVVDFAFIDGHHNEQATVKYFETILPYISKNSIIIFDDISWSKGMKRAWKKISKHEKVSFSLNLYQIGICLIFD
ncbi:MAG: class I SAM-dependent methyltransferase [Bacteroidales bacterium]|nr:class I SAM-dependent methyltransferase [Bacteroidales bacterium]